MHNAETLKYLFLTKVQHLKYLLMRSTAQLTKILRLRKANRYVVTCALNTPFAKCCTSEKRIFFSVSLKTHLKD